jgi:hypothetical protein
MGFVPALVLIVLDMVFANGALSEVYKKSIFDFQAQERRGRGNREGPR